MKQFDLHGWDYGHRAEQIASLIERISKFHPDRGMGRIILRHCFEQWGGKAFGLALCECIAAKIPGCSVPLWTAFTPEQQKARLLGPEDLHFFGGVPLPPSKKPKWIWRSSDPREDWLDPRAGVLESHVCKHGDEWNTLREIRKEGQPLVLQQCVEGIGVVMDIGYSDLLQQLIVRIAFGRTTRRGEDRVYTSPTNDTETTIAIWDSETGEIIDWGDKEHGGGLNPPRLAKLLPPDLPKKLARAFYDAVQKVGLMFGTQIELYLHPHAPYIWYLVQIRPSPGMVRGLNSGVEFDGKTIPPNPLAITPAVNKVFDVEGEIRLIDWVNDRKPDLIRDKVGELIGGFSFSSNPKIQDSLPLHGKIVVTRFYADKYLVRDEAAALASLGAIGLMSTHGFAANTAHGSIQHAPVDETKLRDFTNEKAGVIRISWVTQEHLMIAIKAGETLRVRIISDGLIAQLFVL